MVGDLLDTDGIIASAENATATSGLVDDALRSRIDRLAGAFRKRLDRNTTHDEATRRQLVAILARRLAIAEDIATHPQILEEQIEAPIVIVGFARSGTTLLQSLLAADPANRPVVAWRTREPSPPPGLAPITEYRRRRAAIELERFVERCQGILPFHPYFDGGADAVIEDEEIFALDFLNFYPSLLYDAPSLAIDISIDDGVAAYGFLKQFLQHQQWRCPRQRWILKGTEHQRQLPALFEVFPDAKCIWAHRDPDTFVPSILAMSVAMYGAIANRGIDRAEIAANFVPNFVAEIDRILADPSSSDPRILHVAFNRLAHDPVSVLRDAYRSWGLDFCEAAESGMRGWLGDPGNRVDRYGRRRYNYAHFGLDAAKESRRYDSYRRRFSVELSTPAPA